MTKERSSQATQPAVVTRLMLALRKSSAAGALHAQAVARRAGINATDMECLDLILVDGPATAGEIGRRTGLSSGAVTGLIDRLEWLQLVERVADPQDRRKVKVQIRHDRIGGLTALFQPMHDLMTALVADFSDADLGRIADFHERANERVLALITAMNRPA